jgi:hypothetical protein
MGVSDSIFGGLSGVINNASAMTGDLAGGNAALQTILTELKASEAEALAESPAATGSTSQSAIDRLFSDPNFKYTSTMDDWKSVAKYGEDYVSDWYAKNPYWNTSFGGDSFFNMPPNASFLVGYQNGVPVYANAAGGATTIGPYYSVDSSGKLTYGVGHKGKGSAFGKAIKSFASGGITDLVEGKKLGAGIGEALGDSLGKSKANLLQSLTGIPTFQESVDDGGTLLSNVLGPSDDYFYGTSPMQILGDDEDTKAAVNTAAKVIGTAYLAGSGVGALGAGAEGGAAAGGAEAFAPVGGELAGSAATGTAATTAGTTAAETTLLAAPTVAGGTSAGTAAFTVDASLAPTAAAGTTAGTTAGATAMETAATGGLLDLIATPEIGSLTTTVGGVTVGDVANAALLASSAGTLLSGSSDGPDKLAASTTGIEEYEAEIDSAAAEAAERERAAARLRKGRSSTIVGGKRMSEPAILAKPTILGG